MCEEDFDTFFRREMAPLVAFVRRAGFGYEPARDAAQEAMTKAYQHWESVKSPFAWVRTVAYRTAVNAAARDREELVRAAVGGWTGERQSIHRDPDVAILATEHEQLLAVLAGLPLQQRLAMAWHLDGFANAEIAEQLQIYPATVRSNLRHARVRLKEQFYARKQREEA